MVNRTYIHGVAAKAGIALLMVTLASACDAPPTGLDDKGSALPLPAFDHEPFPLSTGIYRIPYADGTSVTVTNDHHDHNPVNRIDMAAANANMQIVAAASGTIRGIVDWHGDSNGLGDGMAADSSAAQFNGGDDSLEHSCQDAVDGGGNRIPNSVVVGLCSQYNNYVWIEHPNGEWTKYTHFATGSVTANNWQVGDWINVGEVLGIESDIGFASGRHLHFEVGLPNDPTDLTPFTRLGGFMVRQTNSFGINLVPRVCNASDVDFLYATGDNFVVAPCDNQPPVADAGGPYEVDEGSTIVLNGTGSFDPDGLPLTYLWSPDDNLDDASLAQPTFTGVDDGVVNLTLTVYDQVEGLSSSAQTTVTVKNVAPTVTIAPGQVTTINEGDTLQISASFSDPGVLDAPFTAQVECYDVAGYSLTVNGTVNITGNAGPLTGTVTARCPFGDTSQSGEPASGTFTVVVSVTDKDGGEGTASFDVTVRNTSPVVQIDDSGAAIVNGIPTFIAAIGEPLDFSGKVKDAGSDDLFLSWDWGDGETTGATYRLDPPNSDPFPSPNVSPRDITDAQSHAWTEACFYTISLSALDDDGGQGSGEANVVIAGNSGRARGVGYWLPQYRGNRSNALSAETLGCYLAIAGHLSSVFDEERSGTGSFDEAAAVLHTGGSGGDMTQILDQQLLAAWLNFANGAFGWDELVDTTGNGIGDTPFSTAITTAETVRIDPGATRTQLEAQKDILEAINQMHGG
jgi:murein DD-endopeptidase MepM/ murein hydrolase activator NlpD